MTETRKLAAILAADVVGYSRLAGTDEDRTLARLRALRSDLIDPTIAVHHGRVVKRTGDGSLIDSAAWSMRCASYGLLRPVWPSATRITQSWLSFILPLWRTCEATPMSRKTVRSSGKTCQPNRSTISPQMPFGVVSMTRIATTPSMSK